MKVQNQSKETAKFMIASAPGQVRRYEMAPGDIAEVEDGYCRRRQLPSGKVIPSVIDRLTGGRVVPVPDEAKAKDAGGEKPKPKGEKGKPKG
jgi:hypothetical protein